MGKGKGAARPSPKKFGAKARHLLMRVFLSRPQASKKMMFVLIVLQPPLSALQPPTRLAAASSVRPGCVSLAISVGGFELQILEADTAMQAEFVDDALEAPGAFSPSADPYGVVLWPAAQVVAEALCSSLLEASSAPPVLELGAGTGLCALAAAACGSRVLATDYRDAPLELLREAAARNGVTLETALFDITSAQPLPQQAAMCEAGGGLLVAADLLYLKSTSEALARRCVEALRNGCSEVLVGDCGRPGRDAFLTALRGEGVRPGACRFEQVDGWSAGTPRHELISSHADDLRPVSVGLLRLVPSDV